MAVHCMECGKISRLTDGREIYPHRPDLFSKSFYMVQPQV